MLNDISLDESLYLGTQKLDGNSVFLFEVVFLATHKKPDIHSASGEVVSPKSTKSKNSDVLLHS